MPDYYLFLRDAQTLGMSFAELAEHPRKELLMRVARVARSAEHQAQEMRGP